jgi:arylformamidase
MIRVLVVLSIALLPACHARADDRNVQDVPYVDGAKEPKQQSLDVYAPVGGAEMPVIVWIHGGAWSIGDKDRVEAKAKAFNERGMVLVSINYRLHPDADYQGQAADVARAIHWVHNHIADHGGSAESIFLMGHSAGAHLAALVATDGRYLEAQGLTLSDLMGVVLLDGAAYDIPRQIDLALLPRMKEMYRKVFSEDAAKQQAASPITYVAPDKGIPPFLIMHVASRRDGRLQSESLAKALSNAGASATVFSAENKTHTTINLDIGTPGDVPTQRIFKFLDERLARMP